MRLTSQNQINLQFKQLLLWVGTTTLVTSIFWIGYSVYHTYNQTKIEAPKKVLLEPLTPSLDTQTLNSLSNRYQPPSDFQVLVKNKDTGQTVPQNQIITSSPATPSATPIPSPLPSPSPLPTPALTPSPLPSLPPNNL